MEKRLTLLLLAWTVLPVTGAPPESLASTRLHNLYRITTNLYSGSSPESPADFAELKRLGVTTLVSVDGARPDVGNARLAGLRYVHLPIGYDGVPTHRWAELMKAARSADGSLYVHCHHGKHRGPAAAAIVCQALSGWSTNQAVAWLEKAGTAPEYAGLYRSVMQFRPPADADLAVLPPLPEIATTSSTVEAMVAIDAHMEHLQAAQKAFWKEVPGHPDLVPQHEALLLWEQFRELQRLPDAARRPADYQKRLADSERLAGELRSLLQAPEPDASKAGPALQALGRACVDCHKPYRN